MSPKRHRKSKRLVRKEPIISKLSSIPLDWWLYFTESIDAIEWDNYIFLVGLPAGTVANIVLLLCRNIVDRLSSEFGSIFTSPHYENDIFSSDTSSNSLRYFIYSVASFSGYTLVFASVINALLVFCRTREYTLLRRPFENQPNSPSCKVLRIPYENCTDKNEEHISLSFKSIYRFFTGRGDGDSVDDTENYTNVWALDVWEPPRFCLILFAVFSPVNSFSIFFGPISLFSLTLLVSISFVLYKLIDLFTTQLKDKTIIQTEVLSEYETQVVKPLISVPKQDAMIGSDGSVEFYLPSLHNQFRERPIFDSSEAREDQTYIPNYKLHTAPVFPSSLNAANMLRRRSGVPEVKLYYNPAGYFTGNPVNAARHIDESATSSPSRGSSVLRRFNRNKM